VPQVLQVTAPAGLVRAVRLVVAEALVAQHKTTVARVAMADRPAMAMRPMAVLQTVMQRLVAAVLVVLVVAATVAALVEPVELSLVVLATAVLDPVGLAARVAALMLTLVPSICPMP